MVISVMVYCIIELSFQEFGLFVQYQQLLGYIDMFEGGEICVWFGMDDFVVYMKQVNIWM